MYTPGQLEKYSSAITLSDMEIFIFPELMYSLVLANIMSPSLWRWRDTKWYTKQKKLSPYRKVLRLKQFIIDHYDFNLDLETWGLTTQDRERARFKDYVDEETLKRSNALFGYEGDKYYFDIDIRRHFGLDRYNSDTIPYWKTETIEAMDAFRHKPGYHNGAGECVSLAALYAAALYVLCDIPLEDVYLLATPLHSQNFIDLREGVLTNNRRLLTKAMWFNGSEITSKAQRALRNERITIIAHASGYVHTVYPEATMHPEAYQHISSRLRSFLRADIDMDMIVNFLRHHNQYQKCFQIEQDWHGRLRYLPLETAYHYEHSSSYLINQTTRDKLLAEIDEYQWERERIPERSLLGNLENFFAEHRVEWHDREAQQRLVNQFQCPHADGPRMLQDLIDFIHVEPRLPQPRTFNPLPPLPLPTGISRQEITEILLRERSRNPLADLAFYAARDLARIAWEPFIKAALERNPVCIEATREWTLEQIIRHLENLPAESIYDDTRAAQPDEVWNYGRGDGLERALCLATLIRHRTPEAPLHLAAHRDHTSLTGHDLHITWPGAKNLEKEIHL